MMLEFILIFIGTLIVVYLAWLLFKLVILYIGYRLYLYGAIKRARSLREQFGLHAAQLYLRRHQPITFSEFLNAEYR